MADRSAHPHLRRGGPRTPEPVLAHAQDRGDRFASLCDDGRALRIPLRGRCGVCTEPVERDSGRQGAAVTIGPWRHVDSRAPHRDDAITGVVASAGGV